MSISHGFPLEFAEIDGVVKDDFWTLISRLAENQKQHPEFNGEIENELEWVNISQFKSPQNWPSAEERWLHRIAINLDKSEKRLPGKTYVIPFRGEGIPGDVYVVHLYSCMVSLRHGFMVCLRQEHLGAQSFYRVQFAELPSVRRAKLLFASKCNPSSGLPLSTFPSFC
ncbi:hypothetical protein SUGI_1010510 [Cryptomeria japonica]|nr:hypothetical protein SUGI_1010510 [Cryptomeria japonica]